MMRQRVFPRNCLIPYNLYRMSYNVYFGHWLPKKSNSSSDKAEFKFWFEMIKETYFLEFLETSRLVQDLSFWIACLSCHEFRKLVQDFRGIFEDHV